MTKKHFYWMVIGTVFVTVFLMYNFNAMAGKEYSPSEIVLPTDKTDRMLLKDIYANQAEILALLREIKALLQAPK
jgi:hypothetical protein